MKRNSLLVQILLALVGVSGSLQAAFIDVGVSARSVALGGGQAAIADDASALFVNPAGLSQARRYEVLTDYCQLHGGMSDGSKISQSYVGGVLPLSVGGGLSLGWRQMNFDSLYRERTLAIGYGRKVSRRLALGVAVKQLHLMYSPGDEQVDDNGNIQHGTPDFFLEHGNQKSAYAADLGATYQLAAKTTAAMTVRDINQPNVALSQEDKDVVHRSIQWGIATETNSRIKFAAGALTREVLEHQRDWIWSGGFEKYWAESVNGQFALRGSFETGSRTYRRFALGGGYGVGAMRLDYAFAMPLSGISFGDTSGDHRVSLSYRFNLSHKEEASVRGPRLQVDSIEIASLPQEVELEITPVIETSETIMVVSNSGLSR